MAVKAKDLAKEIGVSEATISLVLNGKPGISEKTRKRVIEAVKGLGYGYMLPQEKVPEAVERVSPEGAPASVLSSTIGFVIYKNKGELLGMNSFFPLILDGIESEARRNNCQITVFYVERDKLEEDIRYIKEAGCIGYVIFATEMHREELPAFEALGIPFVLLDNYFLDADVASIKLSNRQGEYLAIRHLMEMGHKKIGYLSSGVPINSFRERQESAFIAMHELGLQADEASQVFTIGYPNEEAEDGMLKVLQQYKKEELPTAFVTDNDLVAAGAMRAIKDFGYRIPEDFSIVGYDDRPICTVVNPKLTTIAIPRDLFGSLAVGKLCRMIRDYESVQTITSIRGTLIERDTVARLA